MKIWNLYVVQSLLSVSLVATLPGCNIQPTQSLTVCEAGTQEKGFFPRNHFGTLIFFKQGSTEAVGDFQKYLRSFVFQSCNEGAHIIEVQGHTDTSEIGLDEGHLGRDRAVAVRQLLLTLGLRPNEFRIVDFGPFRPLVPTPMDVAEPQNRRVALIAR